MRLYPALHLIIALLGLAGCAHDRGIKPQPAEEVSVSGPVVLELKTSPGRVEETSYQSASITRSFEGEDRLLDQAESFQFEVRTTAQDSENGWLKQKATTLKKAGSGDLHAMAFPEVGEHLTITFNKQGQISQVSGVPAKSIFYVPSISLPPTAVAVGSSWPLKADWISEPDAIPLKLEMTTTLRRVVRCGIQNCAELEVLGEIRLGAKPKAKIQFHGELRGILYLGLETGTVIWATTQSSEVLTSRENKIRVNSCLQAGLMVPQTERREFSGYAPCTPEEMKRWQDEAPEK